MTRAIGAIMFFLCCSVFVSAQEYPSLHYNVENGLPSNVVYQLFRDHNGFMWFGTDKGVVRYNGNKIRDIYYPQRLA